MAAWKFKHMEKVKLKSVKIYSVAGQPSDLTQRSFNSWRACIVLRYGSVLSTLVFTQLLIEVRNKYIVMTRRVLPVSFNLYLLMESDTVQVVR